MAVQRFSPQEVVAKLELARDLESEGCSVGEVCRELQVTELTYLRWYKKYAGLDGGAVARLRELEEENARLRAAIGDAGRSLADLVRGLGHPTPSGDVLTAGPGGR